MCYIIASCDLETHTIVLSIQQCYVSRSPLPLTNALAQPHPSIVVGADVQDFNQQDGMALDRTEMLA